MLRFRKTIVAKQEFNDAKKPIKIWDVHVNNIVISRLVETKKNSRYLVGYLDEAIRPLVLIMSFDKWLDVKTFKDKGGNKNKNNKLMSLRIVDKLLKHIKPFGLT